MEMQRYIGQTLGNWRLSRVLGEGAFGAVFEAEHTAIAGRFGAVKVLRPELSMQRDIKQRFLNEASAASRAEHENIVQIFDGGISPEGSCYQVMELLKGHSLARLIQTDKRLDAARAINISAQIAAALQAAHALGIVHRDLKPDNVFVVPRATNPEFVKVLDFGVAKLRGDPTATDDKLTSTGMIIGTAPYMSPEQWQSKPDIDGRADIYALGVILFEMLTGARPYSANTAYEWIILHMEATPPNLQQPGVSPQLARVVRRMLSRQPELRPQTMREVIQDLRTAARGLKNIAVFSTDGTQITGSAGLTTDVRPGPVSVAAPAPPDAAPAPPSYQPPAPAYSSAPAPSYPNASGYAGGAPLVQPAYPQQGAGYGAGALVPAPAYAPAPYQQQPPPYQPGPTNVGAVGRFRRFLEFSFGALVVVVYLYFNWAETVAFFHRFLESLKFKGS